MPIFDYICPTCEIEKEALVKHYDEEVICLRCKDIMNRKLCAPTFKLTGEGFYGHGTYNITEGPKIPEEIKQMSDIELNRSLGLPDDH